MYRRFAEAALRWARVRPEPEPPLGAPESIRVFRAGRNYYYLRLIGWGATQVGAVVGFVFSIGFTASLDAGARALLDYRTSIHRRGAVEPPGGDGRGAPGGAEARGTPAPGDSGVRESPPPSSSPASAHRRNRARAQREGLRRAVERTPVWVLILLTRWVVPLLVLLEYLAIGLWLLLAPVTFALARLEFEQHWYIVTDRSLRIRTGVLSLRESTMSFANLQQVEVKQGPIQNLLGLADVRVRSAGGGSDGDDHGGDPLHVGVFHNVERATDIRDLIVERLRAFRETGLGDPDARPAPAVAGDPVAGSPAALAAARVLLAEARALRLAVSSAPDGGATATAETTGR